MLKLLTPRLYVSQLEDIPLEFLADKGIQGLIIDLDNTITEWNSFELHQGVISWFNSLSSKGFRPCLVSNNNFRRVEQVANQLNVPFIPRAAKPRRRAFRKAMAHLSTGPQSTAVIGDQIFTDVLGGNRLNLFTILVSPITTREFIGTRFTRQIEKLVLSRIIKEEPSQ